MDNASKQLITENRGETVDADIDHRLEVDMDVEVDVSGDPDMVNPVSGEGTEGAYLAHALCDVYYML